MPRHLVVVRGPDRGRVFTLPESDSLLLGRSRATETRLTDPGVSRVHSEVHVDGGRVAVHDFGSAGGTFVNGTRVASQELHPGDVIRVGDTELRYEADVAAAPAPRATDVLTATPVAPPLQKVQELAGQALGNFRLQKVLGVGQVGVVFEALDAKDSKRVALKVFKPDFARDQKAMQRLIRGLRAMRTLSHPNLVTLYNAGSTGPYWWIAMELVEGQDLAQRLEWLGPGKPLDWPQALRVAVHVGRALAYAHRQQVVHRNVLPQNILIRAPDQVAKLGDLALARELEDAFGIGVTRTGELVGNVYYMAPERTQGPSSVDARSDLYSLGVTSYRALTGRLPFTGATLLEVVTRIRTATLERPGKFQPSLPAEFEGAVLRLLAKRPEDRYPTAEELLADLEKAARLEGVPV
jgi:serine/threonine protein kinase